MTELEAVEKIRKIAASSRRAGVTLGIGDDCAILRPPRPDEDLLVTTDLLIENVHFRRDKHSPAALGRKALARGLSDIAAMGGRSWTCFVSLALAEWVTPRWIDKFYEGLLKLAGDTGTALAGGDLAKAERVACDIVVCGTAPRGKALRRDKARAGDAIYVSGELGGSALGLETGKGAAWTRHAYPAPRLRLGVFLREKLGAKAAMDLSDGLSIDLHRMAKASGLAASVDRPLPAFRGTTLDHVLHGGEDYELLFTVRPRTEVPEEFEGIPLTRIGTMRKGRAGEIEMFGLPLAPVGYDHFRTR
ncbi:MAG: thiamine-phosphate kinase [Bryobacteraceae bacterium]|nr:thiamine-phosphate kinase [Bryobacteraceae bacterium]